VSGERQLWVDSRRLAKSYIRISCTSEFGATTDIRQTPGHGYVIDHCTSQYGQKETFNNIQKHGSRRDCVKTISEGAAVVNAVAAMFARIYHRTLFTETQYKPTSRHF
jgi:hypothetical protein